MRYRAADGRVFEAYRDLLEVTSLHRPDTSWAFNDAAGHLHRWCVNGVPADSYDPSAHYGVPSIVWILDGVDYDEDGEPHEIGHEECRECGESIFPRFKADDTQHYVAGLLHCRIDGMSVTPEEFEHQLRSVFPAAAKKETGHVY